MKAQNFSLNSRAAPFFSSSGESLSSNGDRHLDTVGKDQEAGEAGTKPVTTNIETGWYHDAKPDWQGQIHLHSGRQNWAFGTHLYTITRLIGLDISNFRWKSLTHMISREIQVSVNNVRDYDEPSLAPWNFWLASIQRSNGSGIYFACCKAQDVQTKRI